MGGLTSHAPPRSQHRPHASPQRRRKTTTTLILAAGGGTLASRRRWARRCLKRPCWSLFAPVVATQSPPTCSASLSTKASRDSTRHERSRRHSRDSSVLAAMRVEPRPKPAASAAAGCPADDKLDQLLEMGFDLETSRIELRRSGGDVETALRVLLA